MKTLVRNNSSLFGHTSSLFDDFFTRDFRSHEGFSTPAVNIKESDEGFEIEVAAPGLDKDQFKVELDHNLLTISAEKQSDLKQDEEGYSRREFQYTSFKRAFNLPENVVDGEKVSAQYVDGILRLSLPKREEAKVKPSRMIEIG